MRASVRIVVVSLGMIFIPITASGTIETINYDSGRYVGETRNGEPHGQGVYTSPTGGGYEGAFRNGKFHGYGIMTWANGDRYEGEFRGNLHHGHGVFTWPSGNRYEGDFRDNRRHGRGVYTRSDGSRYEGDFRDNRRHGRGVYTWSGGNRYEGDFRDNRRHGRGVFTWSDGNRWEGGFRDDKRHGEGVFESADGKRWEGNYVDGKPGSGTWTQAAGSTGGSGATSTAASGSGATPAKNGGSGGGGASSVTCGASGGLSKPTPAAAVADGVALGCFSIRDVSDAFGYPNFWLTNTCQQRVVLHYCGVRATPTYGCRLHTNVCGVGVRPTSRLSDADALSPDGWTDLYYGRFIGLGPDSSAAISCYEDVRYAACFYPAEGARTGPARIDGYYVVADDPRYVFEADKDGSFRCLWAGELSGQAPPCEPQ